MFQKKIIICLLLSSITLCVTGQNKYVINNKASEMTINGTSSIHDWTSVVQTIEGSVKIDSEGSEIVSLNDLSIPMLVKSIKSGKNGMDKNTYKAMEETRYPNILFLLNSIETGPKDLTYKGNLTISGVTKEVSGLVNYTQSGASNFNFTGEINLNMTTYNIDPPKAMMGTIKTGDKVTIKYSLQFDKN